MKSPDKAEDGCGIGAAFSVDKVVDDVGCSSGDRDAVVAVVVGVVVLAVDAVVVVVVVDIPIESIGAANNKSRQSFVNQSNLI